MLLALRTQSPEGHHSTGNDRSKWLRAFLGIKRQNQHQISRSSGGLVPPLDAQRAGDKVALLGTGDTEDVARPPETITHLGPMELAGLRLIVPTNHKELVRGRQGGHRRNRSPRLGAPEVEVGAARVKVDGCPAVGRKEGRETCFGVAEVSEGMAKSPGHGGGQDPIAELTTSRGGEPDWIETQR